MISCGFVWACIIETKGLSLEQIDELFAKVDKAWNSPGFQPTVNFTEVQQLSESKRHNSLADLEVIIVRRKSVAQINSDELVDEKA